MANVNSPLPPTVKSTLPLFLSYMSSLESSLSVLFIVRTVFVFPSVGLLSVSRVMNFSRHPAKCPVIKHFPTFAFDCLELENMSCCKVVGPAWKTNFAYVHDLTYRIGFELYLQFTLHKGSLSPPAFFE